MRAVTIEHEATTEINRDDDSRVRVDVRIRWVRDDFRPWQWHCRELSATDAADGKPLILSEAESTHLESKFHPTELPHPKDDYHE